MKKGWFKKAAISLTCLTMLVGCGGGGKEESATKSITVNLGSEPPEMLTFMTTDSTSGNVLRHVMEGLVTLDENNGAVPGVAKEVPTKEKWWNFC